jgi:DNA-directed RNA polymerase specialized sigma24 family protein
MYLNQLKAFKNRLRNYNYILWEIETLEENIEELYDRLGGVRGVDPSKEPLHTVPDKDLEYKIRDIISKLDAKLSRKRGEKEEIDRILAIIETDDREAIISVYVKGNHCDKVAREHNMSPSGLKSRMDRQIKKALQQ